MIAHNTDMPHAMAIMTALKSVTTGKL